MRLNAQAFGPGFPSTGLVIEIEATETGLRLQTAEADDGAPGWNVIALQKSGWDGAQLRMEWKGAAGLYSLSCTDAAVAKSLRGLAAGKTPVSKSGNGGATRALSLGLIGVMVLLPVLLIGAVLWQHQRIVGWAVSMISVEQEAKLGEIVFSQQKASLKLIDGPAQDMVREIGARLTVGSAYKYQFYVAEDKSVNAFAMPGGYIVMHTGLLLLADTAEEVAGVLAHEVQHVELRHSLRGMAQSLGLVAAVSILVGDLGGLSTLGGELLKLSFSRDHETQADREGLKALVAAGIAPEGMRDFFGKMAKMSGPDLGFLSTHPASSERMAGIDRMIAALPEAARKVPALTYDYAGIKASPGPRR